MARSRQQIGSVDQTVHEEIAHSYSRVGNRRSGDSSKWANWMCISWRISQTFFLQWTTHTKKRPGYIETETRLTMVLRNAWPCMELSGQAKFFCLAKQHLHGDPEPTEFRNMWFHSYCYTSATQIQWNLYHISHYAISSTSRFVLKQRADVHILREKRNIGCLTLPKMPSIFSSV